MTVIKSKRDIEKVFNKYIANAMSKEVANQAKQTMKDKVQTVVYDSYTPTSYDRTGELMKDENIETKMVDTNTLSVRNTRHDSDRDVAYVVEYGQGYSYSGLDETIGARPFHQETLNDLKAGLAKKALKEGLQRQGLTVK